MAGHTGRIPMMGGARHKGSRLFLILILIVIGLAPARGLAGSSSPGVRPFRETERIRLSAPLYSVAWSPDGRRLAVINPPCLRVYSTQDWIQVFFREVLHRLYTGNSLAFTSDDTVLVGGSGEFGSNRDDNDHALTLWTIGEKPGQTFLPENQEGRWFRPQDTFALSLAAGRVSALDVAGSAVYVYDLTDRSLQRIVAAQTRASPLPAYMQSSAAPPLIMDGYSALAFSPNGETVAACTLFGTVYLISLRSGKIQSVISGFGDGVGCTAISFDADGRHLMIGRRSSHMVPPRQPPLVDGTSGRSRLREEEYSEPVRIFDVGTRELVSGLADLKAPIKDIAAIPGTRDFLVADGDGLVLVRHDADTGGFSIGQRFGAATFKLAVSDDGRIASVQGADVVIYDRAVEHP